MVIILCCMAIVPCPVSAVTPADAVISGTGPSDTDSVPGSADPLQVLALERINSVRSDPWAAAESQGADIEELRSELAACTVAAWDSGLVPLKINAELSETADAHARDMIDRLYYSSVSPEGTTPGQRALDSGYLSVFVTESMGGIAFFNMISPEDALMAVLENLVRDAVLNDSMSDTMLSPAVKDVGIGFQGGTIEIDGIFYNVYLLVLDYGRPVPVDHASIWGHVFKDKNMNGRYDMGEGVAFAAVTLHGHELFSFSPAPPVEQECCSGNDGMFVFDVVPGFYDIETGGMSTGVVLPVVGETGRVDILLD